MISGVEFHKPSLGDVNDPDSLGWVGLLERDPLDEDGLRLLGGGRHGEALTIIYSDIPGGSWNAARLAKFQDRANELLTTRIPLDDPDWADDPYMQSDPGLPWVYWDSGDLVLVRAIVGNLRWSDPATGGNGLEFDYSVPGMELTKIGNPVIP